ncbi:glutamate--tRNA ligase family protein [Shigella flexneri]
MESIKQDVQWLGFQWTGNIRTPPTISTAPRLCHRAIKRDWPMLMTCAEQMREYRGTLTAPGKNSPFRNRSVEENLALFAKMRPVRWPKGAPACAPNSTWHPPSW